MTESIKFSNSSLVGRIKMILHEAAEKQTSNDFNIDMAVRAQQTAELYQIIDGISKDESKLEILQVKQRLRDRIQEVENDIKAQVSHLLAEEAIEKSNKSMEKDYGGKHNLKSSPVKGSFHPQQSHLKQVSSNPSYLHSAHHKSYSQHKCNVTKNQNVEQYRSRSLLSTCNYPTKQYILPLHSCSCVQNAYFYPLAQPSRIRKQEMAVRTHTSFSNKDIKVLSTDADKSFLERSEPSAWHEETSSTNYLAQSENNLKEHFYNIASPNNEKLETEISSRQHSLPELASASKIAENKTTQNSKLEKLYKSKSVQTDKHITWKNSKCKSSEKHRVQNSRKVLEKHKFPNFMESHKTQQQTKLHNLSKRINMPSNVASSRNDTDYMNESVFHSSDRMNDYLSKSIKHLETRSQNEAMYNLQNTDKSVESFERETPSQPLRSTSVQDILNSIISDIRNEQDIATLYSALSIIQETNTQNIDSPSIENTQSIDRDLLEKLIVDVIYEDLQALPNTLDESIASKQSTDIEVSSAASNTQHNLGEEQRSEHEDLALPSFKVERNVITPELSPENSLPSSTLSSPPSSPHFMEKHLPPTPLLSEQENTSEEILQSSQPKKEEEPASPIPTPDLTPPLNYSPKHYLATPSTSPQPPNVSESTSHNIEDKKSVRDASVQVSKLSNSGESTLGTMATSISDSTDEFLSDGELLLKNYGQIPLPAQLGKQRKKNTVTIQDYRFDKAMSQVSKSSFSEGEVPLLTTERNLFTQKHPFRITDSSIDEAQFPEPTNSTFEQILEDISEGQIVPQQINRNFKPLYFNQTSSFHERHYEHQQSHTLSEGEIISTPEAKAALYKSSSSSVTHDDVNHPTIANQFKNNNLSLSSGEIEDDVDDKLNKNLLTDEEEDIPIVTDAEFFDAEKSN